MTIKHTFLKVDTVSVFSIDDHTTRVSESCENGTYEQGSTTEKQLLQEKTAARRLKGRFYLQCLE